MIRTQVLLTQEIVEEVKKLSRQQDISKSKTIRKLLSQVLALESEKTSKESHIADLADASFLFNLNTFTKKNPRIDGFKEIFSVGGKTTEIKILADKTFRFYLKNKSLPKNLEFKIIKAANELKELSETKTLVVRRAYIVPNLNNPPGPRFLGLKPDKVINAIKEIYNFAIKHEYYLKKNSQIAVFIHPFVDPKPFLIPIKPSTLLPYGGYAAPLNKKASRVEIFAVWGNSEGVQSFNAVDRYIVDTNRKIILKKDTPQKTLMLCTTKKSQSDKIQVPQDKQFEQVLSDPEILEVARVVKDLTNKYGLRRTEFSFDGKETIIFNESAPYEIYEKKTDNLDKKGIVKVISSEKDVQKLNKLSSKQVQKTIVYIDKKIVQNRAYDVLNSVAALSSKFTVLYPGLSATAHAMRVLNDFGHSAIVVGNRVFKEKEELIIKIRDNQININKVSKGGVDNLIVNLHDAKLYGCEKVGGKATNLSLLKSKGFNVPHGVVLTTDFFDQIISKKIGKKKINNQIIKKLACSKFAVPKILWTKILKTAKLSPKKKYAVRSSANVEDQKDHSFAGQFESFLNTNYHQIDQKVGQVIKSTFDPRIAKYLKALNKPWSIKMAVVIQEMIDADKSGVVFGKDIQTNNQDLIVIDVTSGLAEGVVDGTAKTQRILYSRSKDILLNQKKNNTKKILTRTEIDSLIEMTHSIERLMGEPQDIEWAIDKKDQIWLIQTRDI